MAIEKPKATTVKLGIAKGADGKKRLVRFSHLHVFKPHLNTESKKEEYSVQLWIPKDNVEDKAALDAAYAEQLALYQAKDGEPGVEFHNPIKDGDKLTDKKGKPRPVPGHCGLGQDPGEEQGRHGQRPAWRGRHRAQRGRRAQVADRFAGQVR